MIARLKSLVAFCLNGNGRANRKAFWIAKAILAISCPAVAIVVIPIALGLQWLGLPELLVMLAVAPIIIPAVLLLVLGAMNTIFRRMQDRGKSANWIWVYMGPGIVMGITGIGLGDSPIDMGVEAMWLASTAWCLIELGLLPGTPGDNAYGPPPGTNNPVKQPAPAPAAASKPAEAPKPRRRAKSNAAQTTPALDPVLAARCAKVLGRA